MIEHFHLLRPLWLLAIVPALILTILLWRARSSGANWQRAIAPELLEHLLDQRQERRVRWPWWLVFTAWLLGCIALAGPAWEKLPQPVLQNREAAVVVLDLSLSMLAADVPPSRLQRARFKILDLLQQRREGLTGLVAYSGDAHVVAPLTDDVDTIANLVPALSPDMMPIYGSDVVGGIRQALQLLQSSGIARGRVLLLTDDIEEADIATIADAMKKTAHTLSILGIGTEQGAPIPVNNGFLKDDSGSIAVPRLHRDRLQSLAARSGGVYRELSANDSDLHALLPDSAPRDDELRTTERQFDQWQERGPWLVLLVLPLAALAFRRGWLALVLAATLLSPADIHAADAPPPTTTDALMQRGARLWRDLWSTPDQQAAERLQQGDARGAAEQFSDPAWRASAHYRAGDFEQAAKNFETLVGPDGKPSADADYNRGNALARAGQLQQSLAAYDEALKENPQLEDARANRKLVEDLLKQQQTTEPDSTPSDDKHAQSQHNADANNAQQSDGEQTRDPSASDDSQPQKNADASKDREQSSSQDSAGDTSQKPKAQQPQAQQPQSQQPSPPTQPNQSLQSKPNEKPRDEKPTDEQARTAEATPMTPEQQRQQQVMEQWLRQIPDDPSGLLRRKFDYEHRQRERSAGDNGNRPLY